MPRWSWIGAALFAIALTTGGCASSTPFESKAIAPLASPLRQVHLLIYEPPSRLVIYVPPSQSVESNVRSTIQTAALAEVGIRTILDELKREARAELDMRNVSGIGALAIRLPGGAITAAGLNSPVEGPTLVIEFKRERAYYSRSALEITGEALMTLTVGSTVLWTGKVGVVHRGTPQATAAALSARIVERLAADGVIPAAAAR